MFALAHFTWYTVMHIYDITGLLQFVTKLWLQI